MVPRRSGGVIRTASAESSEQSCARIVEEFRANPDSAIGHVLDLPETRSQVASTTRSAASDGRWPRSAAL
jgi:hypothetical protein